MMMELANDPQTVRFDAGGVTGAVRSLRTGRDKLYRGIVLGKLYIELRNQGGDAAALIGYRACEVFADLCVCALDVAGFAFPAISGGGDRIAAAFGAWLDLPSAAYDAMIEARDAANAPTNDPDLLPPDALTDEKKAKPPKSARNTGGVTTNG